MWPFWSVDLVGVHVLCGTRFCMSKFMLNDICYMHSHVCVLSQFVQCYFGFYFRRATAISSTIIYLCLPYFKHSLYNWRHSYSIFCFVVNLSFVSSSPCSVLASSFRRFCQFEKGTIFGNHPTKCFLLIHCAHNHLIRKMFSILFSCVFLWPKLYTKN